MQLETTDTQTSSATYLPKQNNLRISEEVFNTLYPDMVGWYDHFNDPVPANITDKAFEDLYLKSKLWRLNNLYTVVDKYGNPVKFRMNYAQHRVYAATRQHPRVVILKSRQQGISTFFLVSFCDDAIFCPYLNIGLMAQGTDEAMTLLERSKFLWEHLDTSIKEMLNIKLKKDNTKELSFSNNSTVFIRVSFRSTTLQRLHISEFGKIANANPQRAKETKSGTLQALGRGNTGAVESTAEGRNLFKTMWDSSVLAESLGPLSEKDFKPIFLPWLEDPDCIEPVEQNIDEVAAKYFDELETKLGVKLTKEQKNFWIVQKRELGEDIFQEYPATPEEAFAATRDGTYYSRLYNQEIVRKGRVLHNLYDPNLPVEVYFDLGVDDYFVLGFMQYYNKEYRLIDEYYNNGFDLEFYIDKAYEKFPTIDVMSFPHDIQVRELSRGTAAGKAKTRLEVVREILEAKNKKPLVRVLKKPSIAEGIELTKQMLKMLWIDSRCTYLQSCLTNYTKEYDDKLQVWKDTPKHDEYSHGADMLRQVAVGMQNYMGVIKGSAPRKARTGGGYDV